MMIPQVYYINFSDAGTFEFFTHLKSNDIQIISQYRRETMMIYHTWQ